MLLILLFLALSRTLGINGATLSTQSQTQNDPLVREVLDTQAHFGQRSVNDIITSCIATIFACTWSAIHPNIPSPMDCVWTRFKRRFVTVLYALLAPEVMTVWAFRQHCAAKQFVDTYNKIMSKYIATEPIHAGSLGENLKRIFQDSTLPDYMLQEGMGPRWTLSHGFFLQMGGFVLREGGRPIHTLHNGRDESPTGIIYHIQNGIIAPPKVAEEDIQDRSKGDAISKALIVLQTTWFIAQCIARWTQQLPVTELEVVTLAYAALNGLTYALWWKKPQSVNRPIFLECRKPSPLTGEAVAVLLDSRLSDEMPDDLHSGGTDSRLIRMVQTKKHSGHSRLTLLWRVPLISLRILIHPLTKFSVDLFEHEKHRGLRVGMFYSSGDHSRGEFDITTLAMFVMAAIGSLHGCIHLIPSWFLEFSSPQEMWLWRVSAIIITAEPVALGLLTSFFSMKTPFSVMMLRVLPLIAIPLYIISRIILLTLALTSLRYLPPAALRTIEWTIFIPHI